jgi:hypothetical protein
MSVYVIQRYRMELGPWVGFIFPGRIPDLYVVPWLGSSQMQCRQCYNGVSVFERTLARYNPFQVTWKERESSKSSHIVFKHYFCGHSLMFSCNFSSELKRVVIAVVCGKLCVISFNMPPKHNKPCCRQL